MSESLITRLRRERVVSGTDFPSPAKCYKMSRCRIVTDDFNQEAIQSCVYQLYQAKEHRTLSKLLVGNLSFIVLDVGRLYSLDYRKCCESIHFSLASGHRYRSCRTRCRRQVMEASAQESSSQETYTAGQMT